MIGLAEGDRALASGELFDYRAAALDNNGGSSEQWPLT